ETLRGGSLPLRSAALETTVPGVFAVGDGAAIGGVEIALLEGRLAALNALARLRGGAAAAAAQGRRRALVRRLARLYRFRVGLERLFAPPRHFLELITPETVVCRCEEVSAGELRRRAAEGATSMSQLKATTRTGMGRCPGRNCLATLAALVAQAHGLAPGALAWPKARPPARPIPLGELLHETLPPPELPDDPHFPRQPPAG
ncbi:MAG: (2Fe-2S)-binding protein, partial [Alphaproteobacteria bacterium]|nr:(2Fe-2S)-binding protein [Alphaproteobacteria bacterium]